MSEFKEGFIDANGVKFFYIEKGDEDAPLIVCLHGFPDNAYTFSAQLDAFSEAGYRVVAPNLRGYKPTQIPSTGLYQSSILSQDIAAFIEAFGYDKAEAIIGHDWGAIIAYILGYAWPKKAKKLVTLSVPYGQEVAFAQATDFEALQNSWYVYLFQLSFASFSFEFNDYAFIENLWRLWSPKWEFTDDDLEKVKATFRKDGVTSAAIDYYRDALSVTGLPTELVPIQAQYNSAQVQIPTLVLGGSDDGLAPTRLFDNVLNYLPEGSLVDIVKGVGHFLHREKPKQINKKIEAFLKGN